MKNLCLICSILFTFTACEQHPASVLKSIELEHPAGHGEKAKDSHEQPDKKH